MKIHFCDLCNESVPQTDLDEERAFIRKGRVICATCDRTEHDDPDLEFRVAADGEEYCKEHLPSRETN